MIKVKAFPGPVTNLKHNTQPNITEKPDRFVIQCGANNFYSEDTPEKIASAIIQLGKIVKTEKKDGVISGICRRIDRFNEKP